MIQSVLVLVTVLTPAVLLGQLDSFNKHEQTPSSAPDHCPQPQKRPIILYKESY